jgi:hypothetical protein
MPITAQSVIRRCVETLQDPTSIRWPVAELVRYLNDGQREIATFRPDAMVKAATLDCVAGSKQSLPADGTKLIEVHRNAVGSRKAVRLVNREILDAQVPSWHNLTGQAEVVHFMFDPREPRAFWVYPPATSAAKLDITYSSLPTNIAEPADGSTFTAVSGDLSVPDLHANALIDYVLYRAYTKDAEYAGNAERATAHYQAFANSLGVEIKGTVAVQPNPIGSPNRAAVIPQ